MNEKPESGPMEECDLEKCDLEKPAGGLLDGDRIADGEIAGEQTAAGRSAEMQPSAGRPQINLDDVVSLRKPHPCGCNEWLVKRVGMDVKLECQGCGRQVMLKRAEFERRYRSHADKPTDPR